MTFVMVASGNVLRRHGAIGRRKRPLAGEALAERESRMKTRARRAMGRAIVVIGTACLAMGIANGSASAGTSPWIHSDSGKCSVLWDAGYEYFHVYDEYLFHSVGCAVLYSFKAVHAPFTWIWHPKDTDHHKYYVRNPDRDRWVFFKVCDHVDRQAFNCTGWKQYGT